MSRVIAAILLVAVLALGGGIIATTAYQAGLSTAVTTVTGSGGTVVTPVPGYGYGWHPFGWGFGFFGFLFFLFVLFIVFGLLRAIFWRGGPRGGGWGPGGRGWYGYGKGPDGHGHGGWDARAHETFDDWHRRAHGETPPSGPDDPASPTGVA
jgi:hypothetical protein